MSGCVDGGVGGYFWLCLDVRLRSCVVEGEGEGRGRGGRGGRVVLCCVVCVCLASCGEKVRVSQAEGVLPTHSGQCGRGSCSRSLPQCAAVAAPGGMGRKPSEPSGTLRAMFSVFCRSSSSCSGVMYCKRSCGVIGAAPAATRSFTSCSTWLCCKICARIRS